MKKRTIICAGGTLLFLLLCACGQQLPTSTASVEETEAEAEAPEYRPAAGEVLEVSGQHFTAPVTVYIDPASDVDNRSEIDFADCTFEAGLTVVGDRSGWVRLLNGCSVSGAVTVKEATEGSMKSGKLEDDFLKLYLDVPNVMVESTALLNTISTQNTTVNGKDYLLSDFPDCNIFCVAYYYENDALSVYTEGWVEEG